MTHSNVFHTAADVSNNKLSVLPDWVPQTWGATLRQLDLSHNLFGGGGLEVLAGLESLTALTIQRNQLTEVCMLRHTATHCNALQYTATHCNTVQCVLQCVAVIPWCLFAWVQCVAACCSVCCSLLRVAAMLRLVAWKVGVWLGHGWGIVMQCLTLSHTTLPHHTHTHTSTRTHHINIPSAHTTHTHMQTQTHIHIHTHTHTHTRTHTHTHTCTHDTHTRGSKLTV